MSTNGNGHTSSPVWMEPQKHSQLSAAQRAKLTDDMVAAIQEQRKQINALTQTLNGNLVNVARALNRIVALEDVDKAHGAWHLELAESFWRRLRWFMSGQ